MMLCCSLVHCDGHIAYAWKDNFLTVLVRTAGRGEGWTAAAAENETAMHDGGGSLYVL